MTTVNKPITFAEAQQGFNNCIDALPHDLVPELCAVLAEAIDRDRCADLCIFISTQKPEYAEALMLCAGYGLSYTTARRKGEVS